jgi:hypothetical protein
VKFRRPADGVGGDKAGYWAARVCGGAAIERFHGVPMRWLARRSRTATEEAQMVCPNFSPFFHDDGLFISGKRECWTKQSISVSVSKFCWDWHLLYGLYVWMC